MCRFGGVGVSFWISAGTPLTLWRSMGRSVKRGGKLVEAKLLQVGLLNNTLCTMTLIWRHRRRRRWRWHCGHKSPKGMGFESFINQNDAAKAQFTSCWLGKTAKAEGGDLQNGNKRGLSSRSCSITNFSNFSSRLSWAELLWAVGCHSVKNHQKERETLGMDKRKGEKEIIVCFKTAIHLLNSLKDLSSMN